MITAECEKCGKQVHVPDNFAGGEGKCKRCGWRVNIPQPGQQQAPRTAERSGSRAQSSSHRGPRDGEKGEARPRRRRKKSNTGVLVAAWMVGVFVLVLIGVMIYAVNQHGKVLENPKEIILRTDGMLYDEDGNRLDKTGKRID